MKSSLLFVLSVLCLIGLSTGASAQEDSGVYYCGTPTVYEVDPGDFAFCDMYSRQIEYKHVHDALQEQLETRQARYPIPHKIAYENYKANLEKVYQAEYEEEARKKLAEEAAERAALNPETFGPPAPLSE